MVARLSLVAATLAGLAACAPASVNVAVDADGDGFLDNDAGELNANADVDDDGLTNGEESELGTDPSAPDSDGDGFDDGDEVAQGSDPVDSADVPYLGGWVKDRGCRDQITGTGDSVGDVANDFTLPDQYGENIRLYDFCAREILLVSGAFW